MTITLTSMNQITIPKTLVNEMHLTEAQKIAPRFFFKQLRREGLALTAVLAGNHDQVRRFLKQPPY